MEENKIIIYQTEDGQTQIDVRLENETVWLTQAQMAMLFEKTPQNITMHIGNAYKEGELERDSTCKEYLQVQQEGKRKVSRMIVFARYRLVNFANLLVCLDAPSRARDNQAYDGYQRGYEELPRPEVALQKKRHDGEQRGYDAADGLGTEFQDDARHETADADEQALIGAVALFEEAGKTDRHASHSADTADEDPHHQDDVLIEGATASAFVIFLEEVRHQRRTEERYAHPKPRTPVLVPHDQRQKLQEEDDGRRIAPRQEKILARDVLAGHHLSTHIPDDFQLLIFHKPRQK